MNAADNCPRTVMHHHRPFLRTLPYALLVVLLLVSAVASAEGSKELTSGGGTRPFLEFVTGTSNNTTAGIPRRSVIQVYVNAGETVNMGSSVPTSVSNPQDIVFRSPLGGQNGSCDVLSSGFGLIDTRAKELAGPTPNTGGYTPCFFTAAETGIYEIEFRPPTATGNPPGATPMSTIPTGNTQNATVAAWDVTVRKNEVAMPGRTFATYLALNMGASGSANQLGSNTFIQTSDGYLYEVDLNELDPYGFIFFANIRGFTDSSSRPTYRSYPFPLPSGISIAGINTTTHHSTFHKIFFNPPAADLPTSATRPGGSSTWLLTQPQLPPSVSSVRFTGTDGTSGQLASRANPVSGGRFSFDASGVGPYRIVIDVNKDGVFGNGNDRVLIGQSQAGSNSVFWDGLDSTGAAVAASNVAYSARLVMAAGEIHFPYLDAENNPKGIIVRRHTYPSDPGVYTVYYDNTGLAATGGPPNPMKNLMGVDSRTGAHIFGDGTNSGFGNDRGIDTFAFYPSSNPVEVPLSVREADLSIGKTSPLTVLVPGEVNGVRYTLTVRNLSTTTAATGATVSDTMPSGLSNVTWSCTATSGSSCAAASGTGNISNKVSLAAEGSATFTVTATLAASYSAVSLSNTATVGQGLDTTDPVTSNNSATLTLPTDVADIVTTKSGPSVVAPNAEFRYTITSKNNGPAAATVTLIDTLPSGVTFVSASDGGSHSGGTVTWPAVTLANGASVTRTVTVLAPASGTFTNTVRSSATKNDPTPTNNDGSQADAKVTTTVGTGPDLVVSKSHVGDFVRGSSGSYSLVVSNSGNATSSGTVTVTDNLPIGLTTSATNFASNGWSCARTDQTVNCTRADTLAAGASYPAAVLTVTVAQSTASSVTNIVTVSGGGDINTDNNSASDRTTVVSQADLALTKTGSSSSVNALASLTYTLRVTNNGPSDASNVVLTDPLPVGATYTAASEAGVYDAATHTVSWPVFALSAGSTTTRTVTVLAAAQGPMVNRASVAASETDLNTANNSAQVSTTVIPQADVVVEKAGPTTASLGDALRYEASAINRGPSVATGVVLRDLLPSGLSFVSASHGGVYDAANRTVSWPAVRLEGSGPESVVTRTVTVRADMVGAQLNRAAASATTADPDSSNNSGNNTAAQVSTTVGARISGVVYQDQNGNLTRDEGEAGTTLPLYAKLVRVSGTSCTPLTALDTPPVGAVSALTAGSYSFAAVANGNYCVLISDNVLLTDTTPTLPASWRFTTPAEGVRTVTVAGSNLSFDVGLFQGVVLRGNVFYDDGLAGGGANDATRQAAERGVAGVTVSATGNGIVYTAQTDAEGRYTLFVPTATGVTLTLSHPLPLATGHTVDGVTTLATGNADPAAAQATLNPAPGSTTSADFGVLRGGSLAADSSATATLASVVRYLHLHRPSTLGVLTLSADSPFGVSFYHDSNCDGSVGTDERVAVTSLVVGAAWPREADGSLKACGLEVELTIPANYPPGGQVVTLVRTSLAWQGNPGVSETRTLLDTTTLTDAGLLTLSKHVRNVTQGGSYDDLGRGKPGEVLEYCISYHNPGSHTVSSAVLSDLVPINTEALVSVSDYQGGAIRHTVGGSVRYLSAAVDSDAGQLGAGGLRVAIGSLGVGEGGEVCFRVVIR